MSRLSVAIAGSLKPLLPTPISNPARNSAKLFFPSDLNRRYFRALVHRQIRQLRKYY